MRTTIELSDKHRQILHHLSQMRGYRGYSKLIEEVVDFFIQNRSFNKDEKVALLKLKGSWSDSDARVVRCEISEVRKNWTTLS